MSHIPYLAQTTGDLFNGLFSLTHPWGVLAFSMAAHSRRKDIDHYHEAGSVCNYHCVVVGFFKCHYIIIKAMQRICGNGQSDIIVMVTRTAGSLGHHCNGHSDITAMVARISLQWSLGHHCNGHSDICNGHSDICNGHSDITVMVTRISAMVTRISL